jgi:putative phage-type endonuclease
MNAPQYTIVKFEQGTREWLEWRHKGIGASDAAAIMGDSLRDTVTDLLRYKRGPAIDRFPNAATARGLLLEPVARERYILKTGIKVESACLQSNKHEWLRASLDGISPNGDTVVEIKCGTSIYRKTSQLHGVPSEYYAQLQHILAVTGLNSIDFWCYLPNQPEILFRVNRDPRYIELLLNREFSFWQQMQQA